MKILAVDMRIGQVRICNKSSTPDYVSAIIRIKHFLLGLRSRPISYVYLKHALIWGDGSEGRRRHGASGNAYRDRTGLKSVFHISDSLHQE
jgi:hypothetical protein